jgi:transcriptional regulator with XRE-family HTH domain
MMQINLKAFRERHDLSQISASEKASVSIATWRRAENDTHPILKVCADKIRNTCKLIDSKRGWQISRTELILELALANLSWDVLPNPHQLREALTLIRQLKEMED